jgi:uncharacterized protein YndB with AHSA1/START domain
MPTTRRSAEIAAPREEIWAVVADPHHLPRWWPRVGRVEGVDDDRFTQVLMTRKGRGVRADFRIAERDAPRLMRWRQELAGTPFERLLREAITSIALEPAAGEATLVTIEARQRLRGWSRFGGLLFRRAARAQLDEALAGLGRACGR